MSTEPKVYFYKPEDNHDEYLRELATLSLLEKNEMLSNILSVRSGPESCVEKIKVEHLIMSPAPKLVEHVRISPVYSYKAPLCMNADTLLKEDSYFRILNCQSNLMAGKCVCPYMRKVIGEVLFPRLYDKEKTR